MISLLSMNQFLQLPVQLLKTKDPLQIFTYAIIDNQKTLFPFDKQVDTPVSCISFNKMVAKYGISKPAAIDSVKKLKEGEFINYEQLPTGREDEVYNQYSFPYYKPIIYKDDKTARVVDAKIKALYKEIPAELLKLDLKPKEIGTYFMFWLISLDNLEIIQSEKELANNLGVTVKTIKKYIQLFTEKGLLRKTRYAYSLKTTKETTIIL